VPLVARLQSYQAILVMKQMDKRLYPFLAESVPAYLPRPAPPGKNTVPLEVLKGALIPSLNISQVMGAW
jgi:hypothetical protein